jgi:hypothetical protein
VFTPILIEIFCPWLTVVVDGLSQKFAADAFTAPANRKNIVAKNIMQIFRVVFASILFIPI